MNEYKAYRKLNKLAMKAHLKIDDAMGNVDYTMLPDEDSYWNCLTGKGENAMGVHQCIISAVDTLKEFDEEWSKCIKKMYKEYEDAPWE